MCGQMLSQRAKKKGEIAANGNHWAFSTHWEAGSIGQDIGARTDG